MVHVMLSPGEERTLKVRSGALHCPEPAEPAGSEMAEGRQRASVVGEAARTATQLEREARGVSTPPKPSEWETQSHRSHPNGRHKQPAAAAG